MNRSVIRTLLARDLGMIRRSRALMLPMLFLPTLLLVILPAAIGLAARERSLDVDRFIEMLPGGLADPVLAHPPDERLIILVLGYMVAPLFLIVPLMVSSVLAADTFAGEKERKTLETLLHLPVSDRDLYVAKLLSTFIPSTAISWLGFTVFCIVSNIVCWPVMGRIFLPTGTWMIVILWLAPAVAALGLGVMVRVSIRVENTQEAQQLGGAVVLPFVVIAVGQTTGLLLAGPVVTMAVGSVVWLIAALLNIRGMQLYRRSSMAARL
ncbi:MAG: ABC transporter permease subunit [Acidimicrobiales bacterium]|nr:ABC transporter permease subunit [Acidimicrobiales bacterium]